MVQSSSTIPDGAAKWRNRTYRRFQVADLWTTPPGPRWSSLVQCGPGWSSLVQGGPVGVQSGRAPLRADRTVRSARQAAGSNRGELKRSAAACGADRSGSPGVARRIPRLAGSGPGWTTPHWSKVVQGGPGWSRVVQAARCGRGPAHHPGAVRNRRTGRFRVDWPSMGRCGMHAARTQLGGPPPGSLKCEYLTVAMPLRLKIMHFLAISRRKV